MAKDEFSDDDSKDQLYVPVKSRRKVKTKRIEFDEWGSKPLIEFLKAIGKDTGNQISQYELTTVVNEYVNKNNLTNPAKKKRIMCDDWLQYLFGKKVVPRIKIYDLLEPHLAANHDDSEPEDSRSSEEIEENEMAASRKRKALNLGNKVSHNSKKLPGTPKSCFASIIRENIKLVYLNRSLIEELLKDPETFESKVVGSYVRIKSDPNDYSQKNSHQLLQVTGVRKAHECGDVGAKIFLKVSNMIKEIPISKLSNENFKEEECVDLHNRMLAGSIRPTVMEFQQKAQILHEVITKQGLAKQLSLLENLINHANEKGWRRELHEYAEKKKLLSKPSEQERLLHEVPTVIAEELEPEDTVQVPAEDERKDDGCLPELTIGGPLANIPFDTGTEQDLSNVNICTADVAEDKSDTPVQQQKQVSDAMNSKDMSAEPQVTETINQLVHTEVEDIIPEMMSIRSEEKGTGPANTEEKSTEPRLVDLNDESNPEVVNFDENKLSPEIATQLTNPPVIEISDDDDDDDDREGTDSHNQPEILYSPESKIWYYNDPHGIEQGPFSMSLLRKWKGQGYFSPTFMVWKVDDSPVLLDDMISLYFPS